MAHLMLAEMTIRELDFLASLPRFASLRVAALAYGISAVNVTRLLKSIERKLGIHLVERSHSGIALTDKAERLALAAAVALRSMHGLSEVLSHEQLRSYGHSLTVGSRGFLNVFLSPAIIAAVEAKAPATGLKFLDLSPEETVDAAKAGFLDIAVVLEGTDYGRNWDVRPVGQLVWRLYGRSQHPLARGATPQLLGRYRLSHHVRWNGKNLSSTEGEEHSFAGLLQTGYGSQTAVVALAIAASTDQIVCVPEIVALNDVALGRVVEIALEDWQPQVSEIYLAVRSDRLSQHQHQALLKQIKAALAPRPRQ